MELSTDTPISQTLSHQLSWPHLVELLKIDDPLERGFYEQQIARECWSARRVDKRSASTEAYAKRCGRE